MIQRLTRFMAMTAAMLLLVLALPASADIPPNPGQPRPPRPRPAPPAPEPVDDKASDLPLTIKLHDNAKPMKLELPEKPQPAAAKGEVGAGAGGAGVIDNSGATRTIIAATLLSLGAVAGGLWLARKRSRGAAMAVATVLTVAAAGVWVSEAFGNRAPPFKPEAPRPPPAGTTLRVEFTSKGQTAVLHISEEQLKAIGEQIAAQKKAAETGAATPTRSVPPPPGSPAP